MKKLLILPLAAAAIALTAVPASAHTPNIEAKCQTLTVDLKWYEEGSTVTVTIDGVASSTKFGPNYSDTFEGEQSWSVKVDNNGPEEDKYDQSFKGTFEDCTPATTTTTAPPVVTAPPVEPAPVLPQTTGFYVFDCATRTGAVQFVNDGAAPDHLSVGGTPLDVPANGFARLTLDTLEGTTVMLGPVASLVTNNPVQINGRESVDSFGDVTSTCLDTAVLDRAPAPQTLAFTGARSNIMAAVAAVLIFFGALCMFSVRRMAR